ncbi:MAG: cold-shock protein [Actinomycetota bacterium]
MPQATVKTYDSLTRSGMLVGDDGQTTYEVDATAMDSSPMFRFLRPGQRVTFEVVDEGGRKQVRNLRIGIV